MHLPGLGEAKQRSVALHPATESSFPRSD